MAHEGRFCPPAIGSTVAPFPITGDGTLVISDAGLEVKGFKPGSSMAALGVGIVSAAAAAGGALAVKYWMFPNMKPTVIAGVVVASLVAGGLSKRGSSKTPVEYTIPWESVKKVQIDPHNKSALMVYLKKHKPKGAIHFAPGGDKEAVHAELAARIV